MASPFDHPEIEELFAHLCDTLLDESDRGAVLVGAAYVDRSLAKLFQAILSEDLGSRKRESLMSYPGPISSFSARIDLALGLRLIPRNVYDALHALRQLRNTLAHEPDKFCLGAHRDQLRRIHDFGVDLPDGIRWLAGRMLLKQKSADILEMFKRMKATDPDMAADGPQTEEEALAFIAQRPDLLEIIEKQAPKWELLVGLSLLCSMIVLHRDRARQILGSTQLIGQLRVATS